MVPNRALRLVKSYLVSDDSCPDFAVPDGSQLADGKRGLLKSLRRWRSVPVSRRAKPWTSKTAVRYRLRRLARLVNGQSWSCDSVGQLVQPAGLRRSNGFIARSPFQWCRLSVHRHHFLLVCFCLVVASSFVRELRKDLLLCHPNWLAVASPKLCAAASSKETISSSVTISPHRAVTTMSKLLLIAAVLAHGHLPAIHQNVPSPDSVSGLGETLEQSGVCFSLASTEVAGEPQSNPGFLSFAPFTPLSQREGQSDGGMTEVAVGLPSRPEDELPGPPLQPSSRGPVQLRPHGSSRSEAPLHGPQLEVPRVLSSSDAQSEPRASPAETQLSTSSVTAAAASPDNPEVVIRSSPPKETSKPPEVNVSQVWVQDSPQDYIDDGVSNSSTDAHIADLSTVTAALHQMKVWMTTRLEELNTQILENWQDIEAERQLETRFRHLISASACVQSLEEQLLKYKKNFEGRRDAMASLCC